MFPGIGILAAVSQVLQSFAYRHGATHQLAPFGYASLVVSLGVGKLVFAAVPDLYSKVGMAIIAAAGIAMVVRK